MKASRFVWALMLFVVGEGCNQQPASLTDTNQTATKTARTFGTNDQVVPSATTTNAPVSFVPDSQPELLLECVGLTNAISFAKSIEETRAEAEKGDKTAQLLLGLRYDNGWGVVRDFVESAKWYTKAAEQGSYLAQIRLVEWYQSGRGVPKNADEAAMWWRKATTNPEATKLFRILAEQGDPSAQWELAKCYAFGQGVMQDYREAAIWYRKAAEQGYATAQLDLGRCYNNGLGVSTNYGESVKWYRKAAEQGLAEAQCLLSHSYAFGQGAATNYTEIAKWFRKAAEQGYPPAQTMLGACYAAGIGVARNDVEAYRWLSLGIAQSLPDDRRDVAVQGLSVLENRMSRLEIIEAQRLAAAFVPHKEEQVVKGRRDVFDTVAGEIQPKASGTGFFISADGFLITNEHVVRDAAQIRLVTSAGLISAKVVKVDAADDLALLKAEGKFSALPIASSRGVKLGGTVATVGFPNVGLQGFAPKLAKGEIASLSGAGDDARYFQISVPVQPGNSGGALVDERGNVVGVVSAKLSARAALAASGALPENVNYAVKSSFLLGFLESVPEVSAKLKEPETKERKFEEVVKSAEQAAVLVLVY